MIKFIIKLKPIKYDIMIYAVAISYQHVSNYNIILLYKYICGYIYDDIMV